MAIRNIQRTVTCLAVMATVIAVYFGRPRSGRSPGELAASASRRWDENRPAARRWMRNLPPSSTSAQALLVVLASGDESAAASALETLHQLLDQRRACPHENNREFVEGVASALAEVSRTSALPTGVVDELAMRLLSWPADTGLNGQRVAQDCAAALQTAGRQRR